jgi:hypothetical protein
LIADTNSEDHMTNQTRTLISLATAAVVVFAVGCHSDKKKSEAYQDPFFPPRSSTPATKTMLQKEFAIGAAEDGMLFDVHFDGPELNSLGTQKLAAMVEAKPKHAPLKVFLNLPKDGADNEARKAKVEEALKADGLDTTMYALAIGPNPGAMRPAAAGVRALDQQRSTQGDATASGESTNLPVTQAK